MSSSGHLALLEQAFGVEPRLYLASALHLGTLAAVGVHYRDSIKEIFLESLSFFSILVLKRHRVKEEWVKKRGAQMGFYIVVASVPTAVIGLGIAQLWKQVAGSLFGVSLGFLVTASVLLFMRFFSGKREGELSLKAALVVGVVQGLAAFPGVSRSGSTIGAALFFGVKRKEAARFSFLISIPAICGAALLEIGTIFSVESDQIPGILLGTLTAGVVGYVALRLLLKWLDRGKLYLFYLYLVPLGVGGLAWSLLF